MRHKYTTRALVLYRLPVGESALLLTLLTEELGLVRARAEGLRKPGAKLAHALQTLDIADVTLVRGKEGWRLSGALLQERHSTMLDRSARERAGRMNGLLLRLVHDEMNDIQLYPLMVRFLAGLPGSTEDEQDAAEVRTALRLLALLGLDAGDLPAPDATGILSAAERRSLITRINHGIAASGL